MVFLEHMCFVILGFTGTEGQETERFLGARKSARLLVGWLDNYVVPLWESGKIIWENNAWKHLPTIGKTTLQMISFNGPEEEVCFLICICYVFAISFKE
jgi:hypothetical protein